MKKHNPTSHIGELLNKTTFGEMIKGDKVGQIMKHSTIFSFWDSIVGAKFSKFTKPYSIKFNKLYVSAKSPVIVQELSLYKTKILKNVNSYSLPLGVEIKDIIFNYKNYCASIPETLLKEIEDKPLQINKEEIEKVEISSEVENHIKENISKIKFLNDKQKEEFSNKIITTYKAKNLQE